MKAEDKYRAQMERLGIWDEAFLPTVHDMCILEREIRRCRAAWKATAEEGEAPSPLDEHYALIRQLSKELQVYRETLGLTPKALRRLQADFGAGQPGAGGGGNVVQLSVLDKVRKRREA